MRATFIAKFYWAVAAIFEWRFTFVNVARQKIHTDVRTPTAAKLLASAIAQFRA